MSLMIYVSRKTVIISKYQVEFPFTPPSKSLSEAALRTYKMLRRSESLQIGSSRDQREEVITLFRHYGFALFQAIIPSRYKSQVSKAGGLFIYARDREILTIPWELLYDGSSFFALTQGVIRINDSSIDLLEHPASVSLPSLRVSLNSFIPPRPLPAGNRFIGHVEELALGNIGRSPLIDFAVDGSANRESILNSIRKTPDVFLFTRV